MTTLDYVCIGNLWINIVELKHIYGQQTYMTNRLQFLAILMIAFPDSVSHKIAWTLGSDVMECKLTLQCIYGAGMNAF